MDYLSVILYPLIAILQLVLDTFYVFTHNYGISIILLSIIVAFFTYPLSSYGQKIEEKLATLQNEMAPEIKSIKENYKGEKQFNKIEKVYEKYDYHPIYAIKSVSGFALQLPFLISNLLLLISYPPLVGESFLFLSDLSKPDSLLQFNDISVNLLPLFLASITLIETKVKPEMTTPSRVKFYFITLGILVLIYSLPVAVVLYWTTSNLISLTQTLRKIKNIRE